MYIYLQISKIVPKIHVYYWSLLQVISSGVQASIYHFHIITIRKSLDWKASTISFCSSLCCCESSDLQASTNQFFMILLCFVSQFTVCGLYLFIELFISYNVFLSPFCTCSCPWVRLTSMPPCAPSPATTVCCMTSG